MATLRSFQTCFGCVCFNSASNNPSRLWCPLMTMIQNHKRDFSLSVQVLLSIVKRVESMMMYNGARQWYACVQVTGLEAKQHPDWRLQMGNLWLPQLWQNMRKVKFATLTSLSVHFIKARFNTYVAVQPISGTLYFTKKKKMKLYSVLNNFLSTLSPPQPTRKPLTFLSIGPLQMPHITLLIVLGDSHSTLFDSRDPCGTGFCLCLFFS